MSYSKPCAETKKTGYYFSLFSYHPGHPPSPEGSIQFWKKSPLSARNTLFLRKAHGWVFQALQTTRGLYWGWVDHFTTLTEHLPKHQEISVWQDTYLSLHLRRAEGHLGQSTVERRGNDQEAWRESALLPACKSPGGLILDVRSIAITFPPHPSTSQICFLHF